MNDIGESTDKKQIYNTYGILDENLCPQNT